MRFLSLGTLLCLSYTLAGQVMNDNISYIWRVNEAYAHFGTELGEDEYTMRFGRSNFPVATDGYPLCLTFEGDDNGVYEAQSITNSFGNNQPYGADFYIVLSAWEDDGGERCDADSGDDQFYIGSQQIFGGTIPETGGPSRWLTNTGNFGAACVGESINPPTDNWNFCYSLIWRHDEGDSADDPLIFNSNFFTGAKSHINSNLRGEITGGPSYYTNQFGEPSADVYYSFQLSEDYSNVSISTDFPETNFDTKIYLINNGEVIAENDDIDGANNRRSKIERGLCAGFYQVVVEGFDQSAGDFKLEIDAFGFVGSLETSTSITPATCDDADDGQLVANTSFGIPPYTYELVPSDGSISISFDGTYDELQAGLSYYYRVTDFCGDFVDSESFTAGVLDTIRPTVVCVGATITLNEGEVDSPLTQDEIMLFAGQSTDNCGGIVDATIFPATISASDAPVFSYELVVFDAQGNSASNLCELAINVVSSVEQNEQLNAAITAYPNPTTDLVFVEIKGHAIDSGELWLRDQLGRVVTQRSLRNTPLDYQLELDLSQQPAGTYTLQIQTADGQLTRRILKQ